MSLTDIAVVVYSGGKLTYFQAFEDNLYYLAQIVADIEAESIKYSNLNSEKAPLIPVLVEPELFELCFPFGDDNTNS